MNKKGIAPLILIILVILLVGVIALICHSCTKPIKDERDSCLANLTVISNKYEDIKENCDLQIQDLIEKNIELSSNNSKLHQEILKYKTDVSFTQAKIEFPLVNFPIKVYWIMGILSGLILFLMIFAKFEFNIELKDASIWMNIIIWSVLILNVLFLILSIYALIKEIFKF